MNSRKPISPLAHGLIDYGFIASLFAAPPLLHLPKKTVRLYQILGVNLGVYNALTDHGAAIKPLIPFKTHYRVDFGNLSGVALLLLYRGIRRHKAALAFHLAFLGLATLTVLLTRVPPEEEEEKLGHVL